MLRNIDLYGKSISLEKSLKEEYGFLNSAKIATHFALAIRPILLKT